MIEISPASSVCPDLVLDVVNIDGTKLSNENFSFNATSSEFWIQSINTDDVGQYKFSLVAKFADEKYIQQSEILFTVLLIDYCAFATVTNQGQSEYIIDYSYEGTVEFVTTFFTVSPIECEI